MEYLEHYLLGVLVTAIICSIIQIFPQNGTFKELTKILCGLILAIVVLDPMKHIPFLIPTDSLFSFPFEENPYAQKGECMAKETLQNIIQTETESYILNKATEIGANIQVTVYVSDSEIPIPTEVVLSGYTTQETRNTLEIFLASDIGITKENQTWIGQITPAEES